MPVVVRFNEGALRTIALQGAEDDLRIRANRVLNVARRLAPVDEGRLRASLAVEMTREGDTAIARVGSNLEYAIYVHEGTGVFGPKGAPILPKRGQFMRWPVKNNSGNGPRRFSGGATAAYAFARQTSGSPGRPFLRDALDAAR